MSRTITITDPDEVRVGDVATIERGSARITAPVHPNNSRDVDTVTLDLTREAFIAILTGDQGWRFVAATREVPDSTTLTVPFGPKMLREALCVAEGATLRNVDEQNRHRAHEVLGALIAECDRHRPLGPDGKHGQRHTPTCGCDDVPERYRPAPAPEWKPGTVGTATVRGVEGVTVVRTERGFTDQPWTSVHPVGGWWFHSDDEVADFVPDDAEALRRELRHLQAKVEGFEFGEATTIKLLRAEVKALRGDQDALSEEVVKRWASLSRAEAIRQAEQLSSSLKAQFAANEELRQKVIARGREREAVATLLGVSELNDQAIHDAIKGLQTEVDRLSDALDAAVERARIANRDARDEHAEVERLRAKTLPTDLTKCICPWDSEDRGGGHSEIVAEYEPACPVHSEHVYDPRQGMWVERAARTLPKRSEVLDILYPDGKVPLGDSVKVDSLFALFGKGGAE